MVGLLLSPVVGEMSTESTPGDSDTVPVNRYEGEESTDLGGKSVDDLLGAVKGDG